MASCISSTTTAAAPDLRERPFVVMVDQALRGNGQGGRQ
jgi:hypothetical protein